MVRDLLDDTNFTNAVGQGLAVVDAIAGMEEMVWRSALRHGVRLCSSPSIAIRAIRRMMLKLDDEDIEHWQTLLTELIRWIITGAATSESTIGTSVSVGRMRPWLELVRIPLSSQHRPTSFSVWGWQRLLVRRLNQRWSSCWFLPVRLYTQREWRRMIFSMCGLILGKGRVGRYRPGG